MCKKILIFLTIIMYIVLVNLNFCYAATNNTLNLSKNKVSAGESFEVYINLPTDSIGYDLKISKSNKDLIKSEELVSNIGSGNTSRVYLIQLASSEDRIVYNKGTRAAVIKYTIVDEVSNDTQLTINVIGDVAGRTSSEKNEINESITVDIVKSTKTPVIDEENKQPEQEENKQPEQEQNKETIKQIGDKEDKTISLNKIPKTGINTNIIIIILISALLLYSYIIYIIYKKMEY